MSKLGKIVILNGTPRSGKSSIAITIQNTFEGLWMNLGVDHFMKMTPENYQPGIGLRPGGERPDLEPIIIQIYKAMYESIAAHSRIGINVVVDVGHHDRYSVPRKILPNCARILKKYPVVFVGVHCPIEEIMKRRKDTWGTGYAKNGAIPEPVKRWQHYVHIPGIYDLEVDTSIMSSDECAHLIHQKLKDLPSQTAFQLIGGIE
ncbi:chloramphenicol phosphotransferase [Pseudogracilibacillus sp. SE30717A]|uniref:chloramphenicol phosphotransferase CPT family protein n=1 Tax=Pseudogracilibacillus sp. SE30717A TaxID=3098293 RepID=UPI00300DE2EC